MKRDAENNYLNDTSETPKRFLPLRAIKKWISIFILIIFVLGALWLAIFLKNPKTLPFRHVRVIANANRMAAADLEAIVTEHMQGGFFSLKSRELQQALLQSPWVYDVSLRRIWPDRLEVNIIEQEPVARWNEEQLINIHGELFRPTADTIPTDLPVLQGPADSFETMLQWFQSLSQISSSIHMKVTAMQLTERHSLQILLDGHLRVVLGQEDVENRLYQFVRLFPQLIGKNVANVEQVDCRYPNGIAIQWKNKMK